MSLPHDVTALTLALHGTTQPPTLAGSAVPRLLLVDDEPLLLLSLSEFLKEPGYRLELASTGSEALDRLRRMSFDLVLLDLRLPDMSGHDVMDFINSTGIDTEVVVLSGDLDIDAAIGSLKRGACDYLRKPYSRDSLLQTVEKALRQRRLEAENRHMTWQLECSERLYRFLVDSSPDIIYTLNQDGFFTFANQRVTQLLGYGRDELVGQHYSLIVHNEDLERAHYVFNERRVGDRASRNVELRLKCLNGQDQDRCFENTLMTVSFNSMGIYSIDPEVRKKQYFGTYGVARDVTERKRAEELISYQAYHDILTDLPNRILFRDRLGLALIQAKRNESELAVMFVDLDRFKVVNDSLGHIKGDQLLQQVAGRLRDCLRKGDTLARLGGDEFTLVLPDLSSKKDAEIVARKITESLHKPFYLDNHEIYVSASVGIAIYPADGKTGEELVRHADIAMYHVKAEGKDGLAFYSPTMLDASHEKIILEQSLRRAIEQQELEMYYQPQIDVRTGRIVGAEGLMRWNHPTRGLLTAAEFLPFAEEIGLMVPISNWMLEALCRDVQEWNQAGATGVRLSLNASPQYLDRGDLFDRIRQALEFYGIAPQQIEVEITENICIRNPQHAIEQLKKLHQIGVSTAIDDFGTGYSSLAYLHRFPVNTIKIDQAFVREIKEADGHFPVVLAIISIARGLDLTVIAEGVESAYQAHYLEKSGCHTMQGYLFHKPMPQGQLLALLRENGAARVA